MEIADQQLVARARDGERDAFRLLVERHSRSLFGVAFRMTGNESDAEDMVQETFLRAFKQLHRFDERASFGTWLYRIAVNCSLDLVRARKRRGEWQPAKEEAAQDAFATVASKDPQPDRLAMGSEVRRRLQAALARLSETERSAFVLRHYEGMGIDDVSRVLGCEPGAAKHSVFRAVQKLRRALAPAMGAAK